MVDERLVTGVATYTGDLTFPGLAELVFVRSPHAHAQIVSIDTTEARRVDGVVSVFTAGDLALIDVHEIAMIPERFAQPALAIDVVRYVGERIVAVVADTLAAALDAAERVVVEYAPLRPRTDARRNADDLALVCLEWPVADRPTLPPEATVQAALDHRMPRVSVAPLEGHAVVARPEANGHLTMYVSTQVPTAARAQIARTLGRPVDQVRVIVPHVGGGFGGKAAGGIGEHMVVAAAAVALQRPVRFVEDRHANLIGMQGRGVWHRSELAATATGELIGVRCDIVCDAGAYANVGAVEPGKTAMMLSGPYRVATVDVTARAALSNLSPVGAYRGPGRSEASITLERTLDVLADQLGLDAFEIRRRNALRVDEFPYATPTGVTYDSGNYLALLDRLEDVSDYAQLRATQAARRANDDSRLLGIGISLVVDSTAWFARTEGATVRALADGSIEVVVGSAACGQRHDVMYRQLVRSQVPIDDVRIRVVEGDTGRYLHSDGSMGSRTAQTAGTAVLEATEQLVTRLRELAAERLEASVDDITVEHGGRFSVRGVPVASIELADVVTTMHDGQPIESSCTTTQPGATYPAAAHLSVVEIDRETGRVVPLRHLAITDCGRVIDPASARDQVVGASAQGIAQALAEEAVFDDAGNPLTSSLIDYALLSAPELPMIETHFLETPTPHNRLGAKGVGEIGMIGAPVAVQNAVIDGLRHLGVRHLDMPCTPVRVWEAIQSAGAAAMKAPS